MNKRLSNWIRSVLIIATAILAFWIPRFFIDTAQHQQYYQAIILTLTLLAILWYTWETRRMQKAVRDQAKAASDQIGEITKQTNELIYQRRLSILPKLSVGFVRRQAGFAGKIFDCLEVVNIGNGTAVNITVDDIEVTYEADATVWIRFGKFLFIEPTKSNSKIDKVALFPLFIHNENIASDDILKAVVPELYRDEPAKFLQNHAKEKKIAILARFEDIDGTKYEQSAILGLDQDNPYPLELGVPRMQPDNG